jgi:hypothetical protein
VQTATLRLSNGLNTMTERQVGPDGTLWSGLSKREQQAAIKGLKESAASKPAPKPAKKPGTFDLKGYLRCELSASDKEAFREWETINTAEECFGLLVKATDSGYLLKCGESGQGAQASLSAASTGQEWDGYVLVAHAGNAARAAMLLVYKHEVMMQRDWSPWMAEEGEDALR